MTKLFINGVEIKYDDKIALNSAFNETLDTGVVIIPNSKEIAVKRLDSALIVNENTNTRKYFKVGTIVKEFETFEEPFKYKYTIELVSPTIDLQNIVLPNISITQPLEITGVAKRSIYYHLDRLVKVFAPNFTISEELKQATENIECPENQYNRRNLFEVFNDLLISVPAVVTVLENNVISLIRLDVVGNEINHSKIINIVETKRLDEYCSEIEMNAENVVEGNANTITPFAISPRSTEYIMTTDNAQIILDKPIYRIEKVEMYIPNETTTIYYKSDDKPNDYNPFDYESIDLTGVSVDITKHIVEESVYNTKLPNEITYISVLSNGQVDQTLFNYKRSFLSFKQGNNIIENLAYREKGTFGQLDQFSLAIVYAASIIEYATKHVPENHHITGLNAYESVNYITDTRNALFKITYVSQSGLRFRVKKTNADNENYKLLIDNQSNSYVDSQALWNVEKENVKRLGNSELKINMILKSIDEIPSYAAKFGDYVLTNSAVNIYENKVIFEGYFTKDYIRKNLYTGIKSKARWTSIAKGSEALSRQDLIIIDFEFVEKQPEMFDAPTLSYFINNLGVKNNDFKLYVKTKTNDLTSKGSFLLDNSLYAFGNNIIYSFNFKDNFNAGMSVDAIMSAQYGLSQEPYVDQLGEFEKLELTMFTNSQNTNTFSLEKAKDLPKYSDSTNDRNLSRYEFLVKKDNREIYGADIQMRFISNDNIIIYDELIRQFPNTKNKKAEEFLAFAIVSSKLTEKDENIASRTKFTQAITLANHIDEYGISRPFIEGVEKNEIKTWGICTTDYQVLFAVNSNVDKIYFKKGGQRLC